MGSENSKGKKHQIFMKHDRTEAQIIANAYFSD